MTWKLWLDDQINDPYCPDRHTPKGYVGASSVQEAINYVNAFGVPEVMDLDHDLGEDVTVKDFLNYLVDNYYDNPPVWFVHSANPIGRDYINSFMRSWLKSISM